MIWIKRVQALLLIASSFFIPALLFVPSEARAAEDISPKEKGLAIATEADRRDTGFGDSEEIYTMTLVDARGRSRVRTLRTRTLEKTDDGDWSLTIFDQPSDVKGTAFLTYSHGLEDDDQWLYLPALKRVKRISSKKKSGPFMGSEFAFEDLSSQELERYTYEYLRNENLNEQECFVSRWVPVYKNSGYSRITVWHDTQEYRVLRVEYFDRRDRHLKTLTIDGYKQYLGKYWRGMHWEMKNHKTGKSTTIDYSEYRFQLGFTDRDFDQNALKRAK